MNLKGNIILKAINEVLMHNKCICKSGAGPASNSLTFGNAKPYLLSKNTSAIIHHPIASPKSLFYL